MSTTTEPRTVTITVPMAPPAALSPNARRRGNVWAQREATETLRQAAWAEAQNYRTTPSIALGPGLRKVFPMLPFDHVAIHEHVIWPKSRGVLPDPDALPTYCKAALDGIVDAGIIASDSAKHVVSVTASQEKGTDAQGSIIITITEAATGGQGG